MAQPPHLHSKIALQAYFNSHEDERNLAGYLDDPEMKFYFLFLSAALKSLVAFNTAFQVGRIKGGDITKSVNVFFFYI